MLGRRLARNLTGAGAGNLGRRLTRDLAGAGGLNRNLACNPRYIRNLAADLPRILGVGVAVEEALVLVVVRAAPRARIVGEDQVLLWMHDVALHVPVVAVVIVRGVVVLVLGSDVAPV